MGIDRGKMHARAILLLEQWEAIRPSSGLLPGRQHFDPASVAAILPSISLLDVHRAPWRFRYRVVGSSLNASGYAANAGDWLHDVLPTLPGSTAQERYIDVATSGEPLSYFSKPQLHKARGVEAMERLVLPLARDGRTVDMILALTLYHHQGGRVT